MDTQQNQDSEQVKAAKIISKAIDEASTKMVFILGLVIWLGLFLFVGCPISVHH